MGVGDRLVHAGCEEWYLPGMNHSVWGIQERWMM